MPKYIRKKDEILKALDTDYMCGVKVYHTEKGMITEKLVVRTADTIAELCDSFVIRENKKNKISLFSISNGFETAKEWAVDREYKNYEILGAIWTSKGLIYVAKMNEKGELELI